MPTDLEKCCVINAQRAADHEIEALIGNVRIVGDLLNLHGWKAGKLADKALRNAERLRDDLDALHQAIFDEALERGESAPDDGVIEPRSGGGSKGGGG